MKKICTFAVLSLLTAAVVHGQCNPATDPAGFANNTSTTNSELNILTPFDSTANSLFTPLMQDNAATVATGDPIAFNLSAVGGLPGAPLGIFFSNGGPVGPLSLPGAGDVYLAIAGGVSAVIDGVGLTTTQPSPFAAHPGSGFLFALFGTVPNTSFVNNTCFTFQAAILDPTLPPFGVRVSNAVKLSIKPAVAQIFPNFAPENGAVSVTTTGSGLGACYFNTFNPANGAIPATVSTPTTAGTTYIVPVTAESGPVAYEDNVGLGNITDVQQDEMRYHLAVVDPMGVTPGTPGVLTLNPSPFSSNELWRTVTGTLVNGTTAHAYTFNVNAGDVIQVEAYSMDAAMTRVIDGFGNTFDPAAIEGFDPLVEIRHGTGVHPLMFNTAVGPILVHGDDDSGPGFNSRAVFQARVADSIRVDVRASIPATFVTGQYLLNIRIHTGAPAVASFTIGGIPNANVAAPLNPVTIVGANFVVGVPHTISLRPRHGFYAPFTTLATPTTATSLTFNMPPLSTVAPFLMVGSHDVSVTNPITGERSFLWDSSFAPQFNGPKPDLIVIRATTLTTQAAGAPTIVPNTTSITQTNATANFGGFLQFAVGATQNIYFECHGIDTGSTGRRADSVNPLSGLTNGVYNPNITLFAPTFVPIVAQNDDNGVFPTTFNWVDGGAAGIGRNAALISPAIAGAGNYLAFYTQNINFGAAPYEALVHVVVF